MQRRRLREVDGLIWWKYWIGQVIFWTIGTGDAIRGATRVVNWLCPLMEKLGLSSESSELRIMLGRIKGGYQ